MVLIMHYGVQRQGGWRFVKRTFQQQGKTHERLYMSAYNDGDNAVGWFSSDDGRRWVKRGLILVSPRKVPSEAEVVFYGPNQSRAVALVREDDQGNLTDGHTEICHGRAPPQDKPVQHWSWSCPHRIEQRFDGPATLVDASGRVFVAAREHLPCTRKRTTIYELRGLFDPRTPPRVCQIQRLHSMGDTAYTAWAPAAGGAQGRHLLTWYTSFADLPWLEGQFLPSDIYAATVDLSQAPAACAAPPAEVACAPATLPASNPHDINGSYLLTLQITHWSGLSGFPNHPFFRADVNRDSAGMSLSLQPLDQYAVFGGARVPVGSPLIPRKLGTNADGSFEADFGDIKLPAAAFPILDDTVPLSLKGFKLRGAVTAPGAFCGGAEGLVQVLPGPANVVLLDGSKFGTVPWSSGPITGFLSQCQ